MGLCLATSIDPALMLVCPYVTTDNRTVNNRKHSMRLLLIQGDMVAIYERRKQLAIFSGALQLDRDTAEQTRLATIN